jgi:hypothetical protein
VAVQMTRVLLAKQARADPAVGMLVSHLAANFGLRIRSDHKVCMLPVNLACLCLPES